MKIIWFPTSRRKIDEIVDHISANNMEAAFALVEEFETRVRDLKTHPRSGRMVPAALFNDLRHICQLPLQGIVYPVFLLSAPDSGQDSAGISSGSQNASCPARCV